MDPAPEAPAAPEVAPEVTPEALRIAVVGAGPVGLALALHAARALPHAQLTVLDARPAEQDVSSDPRTLALSLGSVQLLRRVGAWPEAAAQPILEVHVSQAPPSLPARAAVRLRAGELGVPMLGAVLPYGPLVAALQRTWEQACRDEGGVRLASAFGQPVKALRDQGATVAIDAGVVQDFDLVVVAEGGVYAGARQLARGAGPRAPLRRDYAQTAWVGTAQLADAPPGTAFERFTRDGPVALL
ncbi:MAG: 2-octaprenyl-6-methoxyphenyl hydroxylase, partial [Rubrivivax sp.]